MEIDWGSIGQTIRARRSWMGLKQSELAEKIGVSQQTVSNVEAGRRIHIENLAQMCAELGLDVNLTVALPGQSEPRYNGPAEIVDVAFALGGMSPDERARFVKVLLNWGNIEPSLKRSYLDLADYWIERHLERALSSAASSKEATK